VAGKDLVQLALPTSVLEELLRRHHLHLEQLQSLDVDSHRAIQAAAKQALLNRSS
jgi:hypothetical protein